MNGFPLRPTPPMITNRSAPYGKKPLRLQCPRQNNRDLIWRRWLSSPASIRTSISSILKMISTRQSWKHFSRVSPDCRRHDHRSAGAQIPLQCARDKGKLELDTANAALDCTAPIEPEGTKANAIDS